ncbi:putative GNAT superfamily acetyltransferase [Saccharococcus thermophilus]|uniref:Putative GNAT superfamily acetyltransferase n=1 Tax=Saccharococcus thermophilus TaxID=29396 RepID=A0A846MKC2_9BACL|nr:putative GNAT superfamily acetyltransferase [Saccharococcus thermophilus]
MNISLRKIETMEELNEMARLEAEIWGVSPIPTHQTVTAAKNGGIIIGAFKSVLFSPASFAMDGRWRMSFAANVNRSYIMVCKA